MILHLVLKAEWDSKPPHQTYVPDAFAKDGFIHCTQGDIMLLRVANRFYQHVPGDFLAVGIDETKVTSVVKWEAASPHSTAPRQGEGDNVIAAEAPPEVKAEYGDAVSSENTQPSSDDFSRQSESPTPPTTPTADAPLFPHIYGPLNRDAIMGIRRVVRGADGAFIGFAPLEEAPQGMRLKTPSEMANELLDATDGFSDALARYKDRIEGRMDQLDKNIKDRLDP